MAVATDQQPRTEPPKDHKPQGAGRKAPPPPALLRVWRSTVGKKAVMAISGITMLLYLVLHMVGNLKVFFGPDDMNGYAHWLRTFGEPFLHYEWFLWIIRVGLIVAVIAHGVSAWQLSRLDIAARPVKYVHRRRPVSYATRTMRWGGVILALFVLWHLLDLTFGSVNPDFRSGEPYHNIVETFSTWYGNAIYIVAMLAVGLHIRHGFLSAALTLGAGGRGRELVLRLSANGLALALTVGFVAVPVGVMIGLVE